MDEPEWSSHKAKHLQPDRSLTPPLYYAESMSKPGPPMLLTETRTTEIVTTTTTTRLVSLPFLRKRVSSVGATAGIPLDREKELPPTPDVGRPSSRGSYLLSSSSSSLAGSHPATSMLAQASLGVGLSHTLAQQPAEVNSILFTPEPASLTARRPSVPLSQKRSFSLFRDHDTPKTPSKRRTRGLSLNASFLPFVSSDSKDPPQTKSVAPSPSPKMLSRKPSFWSRARRKSATSSGSPERPSQSLVHNTEPTPPLPQLPPFETISHSPPHPAASQNQELDGTSNHYASGLSRSHSEKLSSKSPTTKSPLTSPRTRNIIDSEPFRPSSFDEPRARSGAVSRIRATTNPQPLLQRWSMGFFSTNSLAVAQASRDELTTLPTFVPTPHPSHPDAPAAASTSKPSKPSANESPELYLKRIQMTVSKAEITSILASSGDNFHSQALKAYIQQFDFVDDPLDIAIRRLLMDVSLPRETQQIDRVMEAFASRYSECNPNLFLSDDHPYILAFSLIMLHTDAFNKSNKRKMTKADYIKNTRLPGIPPEVLDCFYDNIVFAPFIFIEDPLDVNGQQGFSDDALHKSTSSVSLINPPTSNGTSILGKAAKVDPYYLISHDLLAPLRIDVDSIVPRSNPYTYKDGDEALDEEELHRAFARAPVIEVGGMETALAQLPYALGVTTTPPSPLFTSGSVFGDAPLLGGPHSLRVTKVGVLQRKDDLVSGGKRSTSRKWKQWGVVLTGSQLLLFREQTWVSSLVERGSSPNKQMHLPKTTLLKPDELLSVKDSVAIYDSTDSKHQHTLRLVLPDHRHILLQAPNHVELDQWVSRINYASAFRSAGIRMRGLGMSGKDLELTGVAAASSHLHDTVQNNNPRVHKWGADSQNDLMDMLSGEPPPRPPAHRRVTLMGSGLDVDLESPSAPKIEGADQFKATFDQVKSDLATGNWASLDDDGNSEYYPSDSDSLPLPSSPLRTRAVIIQSKLADLEGKAQAVTSQLDADLRFIRNIGLVAPFQRATRDRLTVAAQAAARRISDLRLELTKYACHKEVLSADMAAERREWRDASRVALRSATEMLSAQANLPPTNVSQVQEEFPPLSPSRTVDDGQADSHHHRPESSICESFHSALDFIEWAPPEQSPGYLTAPLVDSPPLSSARSSMSYFPDMFANGSRSVDLSTNHADDTSRAKVHSAQEGPECEEAEVWNKTRAAQRVSLVRVPSTIAVRFQSTRQKDPPSVSPS